MGQQQIAATAGVLSLALAALTAPDAFAIEGGYPPAQGLFRHLATFDVMAGNGSAVAEIVDVNVSRNQLVYTDSPSGAIGFVDIFDPRNPAGQGTVDVGGEPTSLVVLDPLVLVGVNTSESNANPSGKLVVVHRNTRQIVAEHDLGGQPDSLALAPDRKRVAIVIENERNEGANTRYTIEVEDSQTNTGSVRNYKLHCRSGSGHTLGDLIRYKEAIGRF